MITNYNKLLQIITTNDSKKHKKYILFFYVFFIIGLGIIGLGIIGLGIISLGIISLGIIGPSPYNPSRQKQYTGMQSKYVFEFYHPLN